MLERMRRGKSLHGVTIHGDTVYTAGLAADDIDTDMEGQTRQVCAKIDTILGMAGTDRRHIIRAQIFITDMAAKPRMDAAWLDWLDAEDLPCRATIGVADLGDPRRLIEVVVTAARPANDG
ncbi:RidA family protein [Roseitranquillus sediminis]|uniref:RidA family protein n=1 Tax=Roseitranquillus sediminis TaxID=2809051 RepID=UPI001D0CC54C|nr:RidA family protein [Roseitranquillus sediminis]MBM9595459.1 RidA family protein [Roseitranquillus sediminis]